MKNFICFLLGIFVGIAGYVGGVRVYTFYQESQELANQIVVDDIVGTYSDYNSDWVGYDEPNPIGFPDGEWVIVITKISDTKFKIDGSISTTGEINNGEIIIHPTKYENGREHIDINYTLYKVEDDSRMCDLSMRVKCVGEAIYRTEVYDRSNYTFKRKYKSELKLYDEIIFLDLRKVADYDYRRK